MGFFEYLKLYFAVKKELKFKYKVELERRMRELEDAYRMEG